MTETAAPPAELRISQDGGGTILAVTGELTLSTTRALWEGFGATVDQAGSGPVSLDVSGVPDCDTAGATFLLSLKDDLETGGREVSVLGANDRVLALLRLSSRPPVVETRPPQVRDLGIVRESGQFALGVIENTHESIEYIGTIALGLTQAVFRPRSVRWQDVRRYMSRSSQTSTFDFQNSDILPSRFNLQK